MKKTLSLLCIFFTLALCSQAQFTRYIIRFKDKGTNPFSLSNPSQYLTQRSIDRRTRYNIAIDSSDLPITPRYIDSIRLAGNVTIINSSKWLNQVAIKTSDAAALAKINTFPFVISSNPIAAKNQAGTVTNNKFLDQATNTLPPVTGKPENAEGFYSYGASSGQVKLNKTDFLHNHNFRGQGMQMTVLDAGFFHYQTLPTFDSIRMNNQILGTWDFVANETSVDEDYVHGMQCLSIISANIPGTFVGTAPKASFYLYRTEDVSSEYPVEEQNFAAGVERSDSLGVDICSVSLGYNQFDNSIFDHTYADMNGNTTISAQAADLAAKKGMLMVIAAGNEGNNSWHYLITPSDADSVLSVGAVDTTGQVAGFSSYGPSSDGQVKPAVAATGWIAVVANSSNGLPQYGNGTSYACPNMAGTSTCLWQAFPEVSNMEIIDALERSADRFTNPDDRTGYGIPDAKKAFVIIQKKLYSQQVDTHECSVDFRLQAKTDTSMHIIVERKLPGEADYSFWSDQPNTLGYAQTTYTFSDQFDNKPLGTIRYRFKMQIAADTTYYLDSTEVINQSCSNGTLENNITILPNPVYTDLLVDISRTTAAKVSVVIQNSIGQRVYRNEYQQGAVSQTLTVHMSNMSRGVYFVTVYIDNKKAVTKKILRK